LRRRRAVVDADVEERNGLVADRIRLVSFGVEPHDLSDGELRPEELRPNSVVAEMNDAVRVVDSVLKSCNGLLSETNHTQ